MKLRPPCLRCGKATTVRWHRGLCHACWLVPAALGGGEGVGPRPATQPTDAPPGSEERILVYMARVDRGEAVFSDEDVGHSLD